MIKYNNNTINKLATNATVNKMYYGSNVVYLAVNGEEPTYQGFCKLTLNDDSVVELEGSGELTDTMISNYQSTLVSAEIGNACTSIGDRAFRICSSLTSIDIPNSVTSIGDGAFYYCSGLTSVTIPNSITSIGNNAFQYCYGLTSVNIPNSVTYIGIGAFLICTSLTSVTIGDSVTSIGDGVFVNCSSLTSVTVNATTPPTLGYDVFTGTSNNLVIYVPSESVDAYKSATNWSTYASRIQAIP